MIAKECVGLPWQSVVAVHFLGFNEEFFCGSKPYLNLSCFFEESKNWLTKLYMSLLCMFSASVFKKLGAICLEIEGKKNKWIQKKPWRNISLMLCWSQSQKLIAMAYYCFVFVFVFLPTCKIFIMFSFYSYSY